MKLNLSAEEKRALLAYMEASGDCEKLSENEWVIDIYDIDTPISLDLVFKKDNIFADGAEYLKFDEALDGWFMSAPIESAEKAAELLRSAGALN